MLISFLCFRLSLTQALHISECVRVRWFHAILSFAVVLDWTESMCVVVSLVYTLHSTLYNEHHMKSQTCTNTHTYKYQPKPIWIIYLTFVPRPWFVLIFLRISAFCARLSGIRITSQQTMTLCVCYCVHALSVSASLARTHRTGTVYLCKSLNIFRANKNRKCYCCLFIRIHFNY